MIHCCSICAYPRERDRKNAGESDERIRAVADGRDAPFCTDGERAAVALSEAFSRLSRADQHGEPDSRKRHDHGAGRFHRDEERITRAC